MGHGISYVGALDNESGPVKTGPTGVVDTPLLWLVNRLAIELANLHSCGEGACDG